MTINNFLKEHGKVQNFAKGEHLFRQGEKNTYLYFIKTGLLKAYYLTSGGKEYVKSILTEGNIIGNLVACFSKQLCSFN